MSTCTDGGPHHQEGVGFNSRCQDGRRDATTRGRLFPAGLAPYQDRGPADRTQRSVHSLWANEFAAPPLPVRVGDENGGQKPGPWSSRSVATPTIVHVSAPALSWVWPTARATNGSLRSRKSLTALLVVRENARHPIRFKRSSPDGVFAPYSGADAADSAARIIRRRFRLSPIRAA
jgi:hypothetical protein